MSNKKISTWTNIIRMISKRNSKEEVWCLICLAREKFQSYISPKITKSKRMAKLRIKQSICSESLVKKPLLLRFTQRFPTSPQWRTQCLKTSVPTWLTTSPSSKKWLKFPMRWLDDYCFIYFITLPVFSNKVIKTIDAINLSCNSGTNFIHWCSCPTTWAD